MLNCEKKETQYNDLDLANLVYLYGNLEIDLGKLKSDDEVKENGWLWVLRSTNHQWYYLRFYSNIIARYYWIFSEVFKQNKEFGEKLNKVLGIDIFDAMKIGTCIYANFLPREDGKFASSFLIDSYTNTSIATLKSLLCEQNILKYFDIFSTNQKQFQEECKKFKLNDNFLKKYEFNPLKRFPVIKTDSKNKHEQYIIPSLPDFLYGAFEGLYYVLLDRTEKEDKAILFQEIGNVFELYVGKLLKEYKIEILSSGTILSEITYKIGKCKLESADWLIISDDYIFQIECKKRKIDNYSKAGVQGENGSGINKLLTDIAKELDKFAEKEKHICENKVNGVSYKSQKIVNIIVFLDEMFSMNQYAREKIKEKMNQKNNNFYILGCWEFELICQQSKNKQQNFFQSIQDLIAGNVKIYQIDYLDQIYHDIFSQLIKDE